MLAQAADDSGVITVQVLPFEASAHAAGRGRRFAGSPAVRWVPGSGTGAPGQDRRRCMEGQDDIHAYAAAFDQLRAFALSPAQSTCSCGSWLAADSSVAGARPPHMRGGHRFGLRAGRSRLSTSRDGPCPLDRHDGPHLSEGTSMGTALSPPSLNRRHSRCPARSSLDVPSQPSPPRSW
jgi:hypothetical protein